MLICRTERKTAKNNKKTRLKTRKSCRAVESQKDCATCYVSWNLVKCC